MSKGHSHHHPSEQGNLKTAFLVNVSFCFIEILGGWYTNSLAILSDALHDLGDSFSLGLALYFQNLSKKERDNNYSYGYGRFSLLGAVINSMILIFGSLVIAFHAIPKLWEPTEPLAEGMILLAILGVIVNGYAVYITKRGASLNEKVISLHLFEDVLGWVAVLVGAIIILYTSWTIIDPILSVGIAIYIAFHALKNFRFSIGILLQKTPSNVNLNSIHRTIRSQEDVLNFQDCHIWSLDGEFNILSVIVEVDPNTDLEKQTHIKERLSRALINLNIDHSTIEFQPAVKK
ncbi:MAG: cation diffusion facilitator family transporter [Bacteroidota bacterium]